MCRASARLVATVDLPTPPLPLATAITCLTPGRTIFCWCISGCGGTGSSPDLSFCARRLARRALGALAQTAERFEGVDAGLVTVVPDNLVSVAADGRHRRRGQRRARSQVVGAENAKRIGGTHTIFATGGARAIVAQVLPRHGGVMTVAPVDDELIAFFLERNWQ